MTLQIIDASEVNGRTIAKGNNVIKGHHTIGPEKCCENCSWDISEEIRLRLRDTIKNFGEERVANAHRIGYACVNTSIGISTNSTCRFSNCNDSRLRGLIESNLAGMKAIIEWNIKKGIMLYRISSVVVPYASHDVNKLAWWDEYGYKIEEIGKIIKSSGMRVSMHPGQYVNINSPD